jgi:hypothetical protein
MEGNGSGKAQGSYCFVMCSGQQGIQKVLDVRFHPGGAPQLVVSCNEVGPLPLYDLLFLCHNIGFSTVILNGDGYAIKFFLTLHS